MARTRVIGTRPTANQGLLSQRAGRGQASAQICSSPKIYNSLEIRGSNVRLTWYLGGHLVSSLAMTREAERQRTSNVGFLAM